MADYKNKTIVDLLNDRIPRNPDQSALSFVGEDPLSYSELDNGIAALAQFLNSEGIKPGDRVALLSENSPYWGMCYLSVVSIGAVIVPILPDFHKSEVHHILRNSEARIMFISSKLFHKIEDADFKSVKRIVVVDDESLEHTKIKTLKLSELNTSENTQKGNKLRQNTKIHPDDLMEILYTSGTTGHSKGVMLTHKNIVSNIFAGLNALPITEKDTLLSILPLAHSYECSMGFLAAFYGGATIYYIQGPPTGPIVLSAVAQVNPTIILSVPLIMDKIYKKKVLPQINAKAYSKMMYRMKATRGLVAKIAGKKLKESFGGNLRVMVFGGAAMPPEVEDFLIEADFSFICGYGLSETAPLLTVSPEGQHKRRSAGKIVMDVTCRIDDPDPDTGVGEIVVQGPNIMKGYYKNEEETQKTFSKDGWLITGDRGYLDSDNYLFIKGRSKNLIVGPSGENIYPEEIEYHLSQNPFVLEPLVYEKDGRIVARVFLDYDSIDQELHTSNMEQSEASKRIQSLLEDLRQEVNGKVAAYSRIHRIIEQQEEFIKTPTKKIKRYLYRE
ncbi:MAG: AMP-binding protein [candidate division KSB1 bacterium]|nr:AMP-binding protein [candidate division KSB1 bacterium]